MDNALALSMMSPADAINLVNLKSSLDDAQLRNRLRAMTMQQMDAEQKQKNAFMQIAGQNPFVQTPQQAQPSPSPQAQPQRPAQNPMFWRGQGQPSQAQGGAAAPWQNPQAQEQFLQAQKQANIQKKFTSAKQTYDRILATGNQEALSRYISDVKTDPDLGEVIPKDLEVLLTPNEQPKMTFTKDYSEGALKSPNGEPLPAGRYKTTWQGKNIIDISLDVATVKSETPYQLARGVLQERLGRTPKESEIADYIKREKKEEKAGDAESQAKEIGDAIMRGEQPPIISGFGMAKIAGPLKAYLAREGFNLRNAELDYRATEKRLLTLNGPQQLRLRQAVTFAADSLGIVEELAGKWKGGRFPILNRANLAAAKNGAYGQNAQSIATQLETQIADLTSELGTVYKGGNSSTDESLRLAAKNLSADWEYGQLMNNVKLIRRNLDIRSNSLKVTGTAGLSTESAGAAQKSESRTVTRTGKDKSGKKVVQYSDGSVEYATD